ncbi:sodium/hydrogen exchanger 10-like [Ixodes scapularis]|uniref:sodium/hydrogen exchanger 10-like n=1 Tax=Ixodes scapularis TaxID=6945 RepID=UPI001AD6ECD7|nr:sodium/hydrogen exchanger 10-like [Ixodes scapularis]
MALNFASFPPFPWSWLTLTTIPSGLCRAAKRLVNVPIVAVVALIGYMVGRLAAKYDLKEKLLPVTDAHVSELLFLYMPVVMFTAAFNLRYQLFWQCFRQCLLLGVGGLAFSTMLFVLYISGTSDAEHRTLKETVLVSLLTCCPEPMFVSDLKVLSTAKSHILETIIMGEPLVGVSVLWMVYRFMVLGNNLRLPGIAYTLACTLAVGPLLGKLAGHLLAYLLIKLSQDIPVAFVVSITAVMATWTFAEKFLYGCGVTTIISVALTTNAHSTSTIHNPIIMKKFWVLVRFVYNTVLVFLASYMIGRDTLQYLNWSDVLYPINFYVAKIGVRFITTVVVYPILASVGYELSWKQCLIIAWSNFKGVLMISLSLARAFSGVNLEFALKERFVRLGTLFLVQLLNTTTLPKLMSMLGLMRVSDVERANMSMVIQALRETARLSTDYQRRDKKFSGADWKWVQMHTYIDNPHVGVEEEEHVEQTNVYVPDRVYRNAAARKASCSILRLQKVCYNKQFEEGMIHKKTKTTILAALQYPLEKETYLDYKKMMAYITVPQWIYRLKDLVQKFAGNEAIEKRHSRTSKTEDEDESVEQASLLATMLTEGWFHVLVGFVATGFVLLLSGLANFLSSSDAPWKRDYLMSAITAVQGLYVLFYSLEMVMVVYTVGMFQMSRDVWRQLDIIMYFLVVTEFVLTSLVSVQSANANRLYVMFLQFSFITLISCRIIKTLQKRSVLFVWIWDLLDGILNRKLFYAYDLSWAYITAEDEAMVKVSRFVQTPHLALMIRANSGNNKLQTLRNVVDIQQRYPNIEVATKTRQAARRILNKAVDGLRELHEGGLIDDTQYGILFENLSWMIQKADGMPTNIVVGNAPFYTMLSVPWLPSEDVSKLLRCFYQYLKEKERLVQENRMHDCVFIICSGIVKVSGVNDEPWTNTGHLANSDSTHYFFTEGAFQDFLVAPEALGLLCFLTGKPSVCECVCETDVEMCSIPMDELTSLVERHPEPPNLVYRMWFSVAIRIGLAVLVNQKRYQEWTHDKLKRFLENGIMPNLYYAIDFALDDAVRDVILIQGIVQCAKTQEIFTGPAYIPSTVRDMFLPGNPLERARPVMLITTTMRYHLPSDLDWFHQSLTHYDYTRKPRSTTVALVTA